MLKNYGKIAISIIFISMFLLILGIKYVLGQDLVIMNLLAFAAFSIVIGVLAGAMLLYNLRKAFYIFAIGLLIGFLKCIVHLLLDQKNLETLREFFPYLSSLHLDL